RLLDPPAGADTITRSAHDAEQSVAGFWPGDDKVREPAFFAYTWPKPEGIELAEPAPDGAVWYADMGLFLLPYEAVRTSADPRAALLAFLDSTYSAGAERAAWAPELAID